MNRRAFCKLLAIAPTIGLAKKLPSLQEPKVAAWAWDPAYRGDELVIGIAVNSSVSSPDGKSHIVEYVPIGSPCSHENFTAFRDHCLRELAKALYVPREKIFPL